MEEPTDSRKEKPARVELPADEAKSRFGELIARTGFGNERIVITRHGKPLSAVIGLRDLEALEALEQVA